MLKLLDKFLKFLKTDRNTFFTYILTLITAYLVVDRIVEMLFMIFTGMSVSYWGPIQYTLAIACPVFAFLFSGPSKFNTSDKAKLAFFDIYTIALYIITVSMFTQWINKFSWLLLLSVPNYAGIVSEFSYLIKPAFTSVALYLPLMTFYPLINWLLTTVHDTQLIYDSIFDYPGISLSDPTIGTGAYTCEMPICRDSDSGKTIKLYEDKRFYQTLVVGVSGSGKTSLIYEPMIAKDIDKKAFFINTAKELGIAALKTGIATLDTPYDNEYLNKHFSLNMLSPVESKLDLFNKYLGKMIISSSGGSHVYRDLGLTYMAPDIESINKLRAVADSYQLPYNIIDPNDPNSIGLNPFVFEDPLKTAIAISSILKGLFSHASNEIKLSYMEDASVQAIENLSILLKEMYPRLNDGMIPNLEDLQYYLNDFDATEQLCRKLKESEDLAAKYSSLIKYFENNFYATAANRQDTQKYVTSAINQLDSLLRYPGVRSILCNRSNNLNYDRALSNGELTFVCTRRGDLGKNIHAAFGLFFILLMQYSVLRRPGTESTRVPHFLYIDEFAPFIASCTEPLFTLYRKYKVAIILSVQNLSQLGNPNQTNYRQTILSNCNNKIVFGNNSPEDNEWWSKEIGDKKEWMYTNAYDTEKGQYDPKLGNIGFNYKARYTAGKIQSLKFKQCFYKIKNMSGKNEAGKGALDFLPSSASAPKKIKTFDFNKYLSGGMSTSNSSTRRKTYTSTHLKDLTPKDIDPLDDDIPDDIDPINTRVSDSKFLFDNQDAIVVNLKHKNTDSKK